MARGLLYERPGLREPHEGLPTKLGHTVLNILQGASTVSHMSPQRRVT